ncbi:hypothetical protein, partial [Chamaesiphon polymorphus]
MIDRQSLNHIDRIDPLFVEGYLSFNGWEKNGEIPNRKASIWQRKIDRDFFSVILPISQELRDFSARICELIEVLEIVEKRSASEIILSLIDQNIIAQEMQREILTFRFSFLYQSNSIYREIPTQQIGGILTSLQTLFYAVGQYKSYEKLNDKVKALNSSQYLQESNTASNSKLTNDIKKQSTLSLIETFKGSFGVKVATCKLRNQQLNLLEQEDPLTEIISETFFNLIEKSNCKDKKELMIELQKNHKKCASSYRNFLNNLIRTESDIYINWGSMNSRKGGRTSLEYSEALATFEFITKMEMENPESYEIVGELIAANKDKKTLIIEHKDSDKKITAKISFDIDTLQENELTIGKLYLAQITEVLSRNSATGEEKMEYEITNMQIAKIR